MKPSPEAVKAYERQAVLASSVCRKAIEAFNEQKSGYSGNIDVGPLDTALRAIEHMTLLTGKIHGE